MLVMFFLNIISPALECYFGLRYILALKKERFEEAHFIEDAASIYPQSM